MFSTRFAPALAAVALVFSGAGAAADRSIVVLPLDLTKTAGKMSPEARASVEEMLRDEAANSLAESGWTVMTGDTTLRILQDNGIDASKCGEGSCHLDTAKTMNVDKFISGAVQYAEGTYTASIRLMDTKTGRILASTRLESETVKGLRKEFAVKAQPFFEKAGLSAAKAAVLPVPRPRGPPAPRRRSTRQGRRWTWAAGRRRCW